MRRFRTLAIFGCAALAACAETYEGPGLTQVMNGTCKSEASMLGLYQCVDRYWYQPVSAAGVGQKSYISQRMSEGQKLVQEVEQGKTSNETAMAHWRTLASSAKQRSEAKTEAEAEALGAMGASMHDMGTSMQKSAAGMSRNGPVHCNTTYGDTGSNTTCY